MCPEKSVAKTAVDVLQRKKFHISDKKKKKSSKNASASTPLQPALPPCLYNECSLPNLLPGSPQLQICRGDQGGRGGRARGRAQIFQQEGGEASQEEEDTELEQFWGFQEWTSSAERSLAKCVREKGG